MQNGGITEATSGTAGNGSGNGNDSLPDIGTSSSSVTHHTNININQAPGQCQQPQLQMRTAVSPGHQQQLHHQSHSHQQAGALQGPMSNHHHLHHHHQQMGSSMHHYGSPPHPGAYSHQRHAQSYHTQQQQQQMQHYHPHHHKNKYDNRRNEIESNVNHVLLITVINPHYTITCDLIHQICSTYGKVNRIVIFKKNGIQAMVEFDNVESAKRAKSMLYGCDIYSGCCTLKIEYAKPTRLNIHKNDSDSFDYTNSNSATGHPSEEGHGNGVSNSGVWNSINDQNQVHSAAGMASGGNQTSSQHHGSHHQSQHREAPGAVAVAGSGVGVGSNRANMTSSGHTPHHAQHHFHPTPHQHPQSGTPHHHPQMSSGAQATPLYGITSAMDPRADASTNDTFHQDGGFDVSREGGPPTGSYIGVESYLPSHGAGGGGGGGGGSGGGQHSAQSNIYSRHQNGHRSNHHHHHHHHTQGIGGQHHNSSFSSANTSNPLISGPSNLGPPQGTVMMVYGLQPERVNCDRLFNLFCLYGNVVRVKFLKTKEGCAMVQMGDVLAVDRCIGSLNKTTLFGSELQISYSKQAFLHDVVQPFQLPDGSPSFKDFMGNKNNRFKNPEVASKNRILPPSPVLHFFNAPYGITEEELIQLFKELANHEPVAVKIFTPKAENIKSFSGLVSFKDPADATEALVMCNHLNMPKPGASNPYVLRLCFSPPTYARPPYANSTAANQ